jgi:hypothetical protein
MSFSAVSGHAVLCHYDMRYFYFSADALMLYVILTASGFRVFQPDSNEQTSPTRH